MPFGTPKPSRERVEQLREENPITTAGIEQSVLIMRRVIMTILEECGVDLDQHRPSEFQDHINILATSGSAMGSAALFEELAKARERTLALPETALLAVLAPDLYKGLEQGYSSSVEKARKHALAMANQLDERFDKFAAAHPITYQDPSREPAQTEEKTDEDRTDES